jgi:hypothetical protein
LHCYTRFAPAREFNTVWVFSGWANIWPPEIHWILFGEGSIHIRFLILISPNYYPLSLSWIHSDGECDGSHQPLHCNWYGTPYKINPFPPSSPVSRRFLYCYNKIHQKQWSRIRMSHRDII